MTSQPPGPEITGRPVVATPAARPAAPEPPGTSPPRPGRLRVSVTYLAVLAACVVAGVAATALVRALAGAGPSSRIPSPPAANARFTPDEDGTGADNQANLLASAAPGLVHVLAGPAAAPRMGLVLTPSGLVLTTSQGLGPTTRLRVRLVLSGRAYPARVLGRDVRRDLALLQVEGGPAFRPVEVGNSQKFPLGSAVTVVGSTGMTKTITLNVGNLDRRDASVLIGGNRVPGLLAVSAPVQAGAGEGGPLVDLSGQVVGVNLAGSGTGLHRTGYAMPVNQALAIARQLQASGTAR
jgi:S1-C subfamily serine protease